jgi:hypothetical protein
LLSNGDHFTTCFYSPTNFDGKYGIVEESKEIAALKLDNPCYKNLEIDPNSLGERTVQNVGEHLRWPQLPWI